MYFVFIVIPKFYQNLCKDKTFFLIDQIFMDFFLHLVEMEFFYMKKK